MKKIIATALVAVSLVSCGQKKEPEVKMTPTTSVKVEKPIDALKANQVSFIEKLDSLIVYKEKGTTDGKVKFDLSAKEAVVKGDLDYDFKFDQKERKSIGTLKVNFDADVKEGQKMKVDGKISAEIAAFKKKVFFKLAELKVNSSDEAQAQQIAMLNGMAQAYIGKWFFQELPEAPETKQLEKLQENFTENKNKVVAILKKYPILKSIKENENADFYDNDVKVNKESIVSIVKEMQKEFGEETKKEMSSEDIAKLEKDIEEFNKNFKANLKIDKKDLKYFVFTAESEESNFKLENTKDKFVINSLEKMRKTEFTYDAKKSDNSVNGKIIIKEDGVEKFSGDLLLEKAGDKYTFDLKGKSPEEKAATISLNITNTTTEKDVKIEEPKDAKNFQEAMGAMIPAGQNPAGIPSGMPVQ